MQSSFCLCNKATAKEMKNHWPFPINTLNTFTYFLLPQICINQGEQILNTIKRTAIIPNRYTKQKKSTDLSRIEGAQQQTWMASYWLYLRKIKARSVGWMKKTEDFSPVLPQIIQLVNSRTKVSMLLGLGKHVEDRLACSFEEVWRLSNRTKPNVKSHFPSFSFKDLLSMLPSNHGNNYQN